MADTDDLPADPALTPEALALDAYEREQLLAILAWRKQSPSIASQALVRLLSPAVFLVDKMVPVAAMESIIHSARWAGMKLTDSDDLLRQAGLARIEDLQQAELKTCDALANSVHRWAMGFGASEGAATGAAGLAGIVVDIPAALTLAFRTIYKTGICYGYAPEQVTEQFAQGILAASGANSMQEKLAALVSLQAIRTALHQQSWKTLAHKASQHAFSREGAIIAMRTLARQLGVNLTKRKALAAIPVMGALVGAGVNAWYMRDVSWAARRAFQERWLADRGKVQVIDVEAAVEAAVDALPAGPAIVS